MSYYTVTAPCVVGLLHYATIPSQPIEVDDDTAAPLVKSGALVAYPPRLPVAVAPGPVTEPVEAPVESADDDKPVKRARVRR